MVSHKGGSATNNKGVGRTSQSKTIDLAVDTDDSGKIIGTRVGGRHVKLGCDVVAGDDCWVSKQLFRVRSFRSCTDTGFGLCVR